jgi:hypothetical protein
MGMRRRWIIFALLGPVFLIGAFILSYFAFEFSTVDDQGFKDFCGEAQVVQDGFQQFFRNRQVYPAYSMEQLQRMGAIEDELPQEYWVYYTPFSSKTPDNTIVLRMGYGPFGFIPSFCDFSWTKGQLTHNTEWEPNPWKERLEVIKEKQVQQFESEHPLWKILAASADFDGTVPENSHAELLIDYMIQGDPKLYRAHFDLFEKNDSWACDGKTTLFQEVK